MGINYQGIINSRLGVGFTLAFARFLPPFAAYPVANILAGALTSRSGLEMVKAARVNQWVVNGEKLTADELDEAVSRTVRHTARCLYETYHYFRDEDAIARLIILTDDAKKKLAEVIEAKHGAIIVGLHLSNFDFVGQAVSGTDIEALALAFPRPPGGYRWQNYLRRESGMEIVPTSVDSMRKASQLLKEGGLVMTAIDRPLLGSNYPVRFFEHQAYLPLHHITLALKTDAPVYVVAVIMNEENRYEIVYSEAVHMDRIGDRHENMIHNGEKVLEIAAGFIRLAPNQWSMYYPVWPEIQDSLPY
jgi:KDO2-lipid IV(A) lauroyltransferase